MTTGIDRFEQTLAACGDGWQLAIRRGRRVVAKLTPPNPHPTLAQWLVAEGLEPGEYRCSIRALGEDRTERRAALRRHGPLQAQVFLTNGVIDDADDDDEADDERVGSEARQWGDRTQAAIAKRKALQAEIELREIEDRQARIEKSNTAGYTPLEQELLREMRDLRESLKPTTAPGTTAVDQVQLFREVFKMVGDVMKASAPAVAPPPPTTTPSSRREIKEMVEIMGLLREEFGGAASGGESQSDIAAAFDFGKQYLRFRREATGTPTPGVTASGLVTPPVAAPVAATPPPGAPAAPDPSRQRVAAFLELVQQELRNGTRAEDAADAIVDTDLYRLAPGILRDRLEGGDLAQTLQALQDHVPPEQWSVFQQHLTTDSQARAWLLSFFGAIANPPSDAGEPYPETAVPVDGQPQ